MIETEKRRRANLQRNVTRPQRPTERSRMVFNEDGEFRLMRAAATTSSFGYLCCTRSALELDLESRYRRTVYSDRRVINDDLDHVAN